MIIKLTTTLWVEIVYRKLTYLKAVVRRKAYDRVVVEVELRQRSFQPSKLLVDPGDGRIVWKETKVSAKNLNNTRHFGYSIPQWGANNYFADSAKRARTRRKETQYSVTLAKDMRIIRVTVHGSSSSSLPVSMTAHKTHNSGTNSFILHSADGGRCARYTSCTM